MSQSYTLDEFDVVLPSQPAASDITTALIAVDWTVNPPSQTAVDLSQVPAPLFVDQGNGKYKCRVCRPQGFSGGWWSFTDGQDGSLPATQDVGAYLVSTPPPALPGTPTAAAPITLAGVKAKLVGLDFWLSAAASSDAAYTDARILANVPAMLRKFERETTTLLGQRQVITQDDGTYAVRDPATGKLAGTNGLPVKQEDAYPYYTDDATNYFMTSLKSRPVQSVQRARITFKNLTVFQIPGEWIVVDQHSGKFQILPVGGAIYGEGISAGFALLQMNYGSQDYIPHSVQFDYVAGLPTYTDGQGVVHGWWDDDEYADLLITIEEFCALQVLHDIAHLADAGLVSKSISGSGSGESISYTRFADRKAELQAKYDAFKELYSAQESPVMLLAG